MLHAAIGEAGGTASCGACVVDIESNERTEESPGIRLSLAVVLLLVLDISIETGRSLAVVLDNSTGGCAVLSL